MRSRSNGGVIGAYALPSQNYANGVFFIHDAAIFNTGASPIWPLASGIITNATGGTITTSGNYKTHTFTTNGTFQIVTGSSQLELLVVGGGGGGGGGIFRTSDSVLWPGSGGGAGGLVLVNTFATSGTYTVNIGQGGQGGQGGSQAVTPDSGLASRGGISFISGENISYYALGGGAGTGTPIGSALINGGSAGGSNSTNNNSPSISLQNSTYGYGVGYGGGFTQASNYPYGGSSGGGGASAVGGNSPGTSTGQNGSGGAGYTWTDNQIYASGGGGGGAYLYSGATQLTPGYGGMGLSSYSIGGTAVASTMGDVGPGRDGRGDGGGGGGASISGGFGYYRNGAYGGSGVVIIRYRYR